MRRVTSTTDPAGRTTSFQWCTCGALEGIVDANGNTTSFVYNATGQLTDKVYDDGKGLKYGYEPLSGRLATMTDAKNQTTRYRYNLDDTLASVTYENAAGESLERTVEGPEDRRGSELFLRYGVSAGECDERRDGDDAIHVLAGGQRRHAAAGCGTAQDRGRAAAGNGGLADAHL